MSKVISFRLDRSNPREKQALDILKKWEQDGFSKRQVITIALIGLKDDVLYCHNDNIEEISMKINQSNNNIIDARNHNIRMDNNLTHTFLLSVKKRQAWIK
jgi:hypothetical protein